MYSLSKMVLVCLILLCLLGCTIHFKGKDVEFTAERQRVQNNDTYELEKIELLRG